MQFLYIIHVSQLKAYSKNAQKWRISEWKDEKISFCHGNVNDEKMQDKGSSTITFL